MPKAGKRTLSPRLIEIRARWQQRVSAQRASGTAQTLWCRQTGIEPKYGCGPREQFFAAIGRMGQAILGAIARKPATASQSRALSPRRSCGQLHFPDAAVVGTPAITDRTCAHDWARDYQGSAIGWSAECWSKNPKVL